MACEYPMPAERTEDGRVVMVARKGDRGDAPLTLACGQCRGCRLERSRQWAMRCMHEAAQHESNSFVTLTYDDEHLPENGSLEKPHMALFMRRLRKRLAREGGPKVRFYGCGEYGDKYGRPHLHLCLFGWNFPDRQHWKTTERGDPLYISDQLAKVWTFGQHQVGELTFESAAYVARYVMKKVNGHKQEEHYAYEWHVDTNTGEITVKSSLQPEFNNMSRKPGIGKRFYEKHKDTIYRDDGVIFNERMIKPPKYYDRLYEIEQPTKMQDTQATRELERAKTDGRTREEIRKVRRRLTTIREKQLKRDLE